MGGVFASWGSLGHITFAEPGALIGFLGPRVYKALYGRDFPEGVQVAENLYRSGVIDGVLPVSVFRRIAHRALSVLSGCRILLRRNPVGPRRCAGPGMRPRMFRLGNRFRSRATQVGPVFVTYCAM